MLTEIRAIWSWDNIMTQTNSHTETCILVLKDFREGPAFMIALEQHLYHAVTTKACLIVS